MNLNFLLNASAVKAQLACYDLTGPAHDPLIPELWAQEALMRLENTMVISHMVHRDYSQDVASFGDTVNAHRPNDLKINRKSDSDLVNFQDVSVQNVPVKLNQWFSEGFTIKDGEQSLSFKDLVELHLNPAADAIANGVDRALLGQAHQFLANRQGRIGKLNSANAGDYLLDVRTRMTNNKAPMSGRSLILHPNSEAPFLKNELFVAADKRGDGGTALTEAKLGRIYGYDTYAGQNVTGVSGGVDAVIGTVTNAIPANTAPASIAVAISSNTVVGEFAIVDGDDQPVYITARTGTGSTTAVTLSERTRFGSTAGAQILVVKSNTVNATGDSKLAAEGHSGYPIGWSRTILIDGYGADYAPQIGQLLAFGTGATRRTYSIIEVTPAVGGSAVLLDRPLDLPVANDEAAFPGPVGSLNLAFHRNALALVTRPLQLPRGGSGVSSAVVSYNGLGIRVSMQYDLAATGTKVHLDMLAGVAVLDTNLAAVLLG